MLLFGVDLRDQMHICTYDLAKVLDEGQPQGLDDLIKVYLGKEDHKAEVARYRETRGITEGSYGLVPPEIRLPYGCKDGRRTFELAARVLGILLLTIFLSPFGLVVFLAARSVRIRSRA